jgi:hypothetical protein
MFTSSLRPVCQVSVHFLLLTMTTALHAEPQHKLGRTQ